MFEGPVLHVLVIGFHHKKGCQVEYVYPPLIEGDSVDSTELPEQWKHLPSLALPDGAHNYEEDTIYFHLPSLNNPRETVYGISCYRQMNAEKLLHRSLDITRGSVQKSVCVLSILPLYGLIQAKLELITHAYFDERDFSKVSLLEDTYKNLNMSLSKNMVGSTQVFLGLSVRDVILNFKHKTVLLFKLLLLERKVLFSKSPVKDLCAVILSICSLYPGMIEKGLVEAASSISSKHYATELRTSNEHDYLEVHFTDNNSDVALKTNGADLLKRVEKGTEGKRNPSEKEHANCDSNCASSVLQMEDNICYPSISSNNSNTVTETSFKQNEIHSIQSTRTCNMIFDEEDKLLDEIDAVLSNQNEKQVHFTNSNSIDTSLITVCDTGCENRSGNVNDENICETVEENTKNANIIKDKLKSLYVDKSSTVTYPSFNHVNIDVDDCGFPLAIFMKGSLCHPYLSLPYLDLLSDVNIRSFVVGATNVLFKQKKFLFDVIVEIDEAKVDIIDVDLRSYLHLTTEDLRFADHIVRHVMEDTEDVFLDGTGWEGGDEWLRAQFKVYLMSLLRTSQLEENSKEYDAFNASFMNIWKTTHNYKIWSSTKHPGIFEVNPGHPFHGQISMADMRLRISHTMQSSERGRKLNQVVSSTGKVVSQTGKVVGGAFSTAKSVVSSWWSHLGSTPQLQNQSLKEIDGDLNLSETLPKQKNESLISD